MLNREEVIAMLRPHYPYLAAQCGVRRIGLFGSYAQGESGEASDIDLIVEFERPVEFQFVELAEYPENLPGRRVDLLTPAGVRGIRQPWVAAEIERSTIYV